MHHRTLLAALVASISCQAPGAFDGPHERDAGSDAATQRTFTFSVIDPKSSIGARPVGEGRFTIGDFDGDGKDDILFGDGLLYADGKTTTLFSWTDDHLVWTAGDLDGDGYDDAFVQLKSTLDLHFGSSSGLGTTGTAFSSSLALSTVAPMDTNSDGYGDVWLCRFQTCTLHLGSSSGLSTTTSATLGPWTSLDAAFAYGSVVGDFDDDGQDELVLSGDFYKDRSMSAGGFWTVDYEGHTALLVDRSGSSWTETWFLDYDYDVFEDSWSRTTDIDRWDVAGVVPGHLSGGGDGLFLTSRVFSRCSPSCGPTTEVTTRGICTSTTATSTAPCSGTFTEVDEYAHFLADLDGDGSQEVAYTTRRTSYMVRDGLFSGDVAWIGHRVSPLVGRGDFDGDGQEEIVAGDSGALVILDPKASAPKDADGDGYTDETDCDETDSSVYPGATETTADGVDSDCDGEETCYVDADSDGYRTSTTVASTVVSCVGSGLALASAPAGDCDDTDSAVNPGATEVVGDEVDADCDGRELCWVDDDGDGARGSTSVVSADVDCASGGEAKATAPVDCDDSDSAVFPGATEIIGDGVDSDCDGRERCWADLDLDGARGASAVASSDPDCADPGEALTTAALDCDDLDAAIRPGATEVVGDEVDQDCDGGEICYLDADGDGSRSPSTLPSADVDCRDAREAGALQPLDCDDADPLRSPTFAEVAGDLRDGNCDGLELCYVDADEDGHATTETRASAFVTCGVPGLADATVPRDDCDDADPLRNPSMPEVVGDEFDSDCDGTELCFTDADGDGWRTGASVLSVDASCDGPGEAAASVPAPDCDDGDAGRSPGETEVVGDGVDQDCDGLELCYVDADDDGWRPAGGATVASADLDCTDSGEAEPTDPVGDCDDADPYRATGFSEIVGDEIDGDCDGQELCYVDADGDRFVDATAQVVSADSDCSDPGEAVDPFGIPDCDDADASSNPLAYDIPGDGIDQDCDGADAPSPPSACSTGGTGSGLGWLGIGLGVMLMRRRVTGRAA